MNHGPICKVMLIASPIMPGAEFQGSIVLVLWKGNRIALYDLSFNDSENF